MDLKLIHRDFISGRWTILISVLLFSFARMLNISEIENWGIYVSVAAFQIGISLLLQQVNNTFNIINKRTILPAFFFLLFTQTDTRNDENLMGIISVLVIALCLIFAFKSYRNTESQMSSFNVALLLTLGSVLCWNPLVFFIPLFWLGFYILRSFSIKSFAASLIGILTIYFFFSAWCLYQENWNLFIEKLPQIKQLSDIRFINLSIMDWIVFSVFFILLIISGINILMVGISEKIQTAMFLRVLLLFAGVTLILSFFFSSMTKNLKLIGFVPFSYIFARYFTLSEKKYNIILLSIIILFFIFRFFI